MFLLTQGNESFKGKNSGAGAAKVNMDPSAIAALRKAVEGNQNCCDCDAPSELKIETRAFLFHSSFSIISFVHAVDKLHF